MKNKLTTIAMILLAVFITLGGTTSCKSKKRLAKEAAEAEYKSKVADAIKDLNAILNDETLWTLEEKEARVQTIKDWNLQNAEVDDLLFQVEKKLARERAQRNEEERRLFFFLGTGCFQKAVPRIVFGNRYSRNGFKDMDPVCLLQIHIRVCSKICAVTEAF